MKAGTALTRSDIARLIPHQGTMCLLAGVTAWDQETVVCHADNHRDPHHPLRTRSGLLSACLLEYAAQAVAVHAALQSRAGASRTPIGARPGMLAAARQVELALLNLDPLPRSVPDELRIEARCEARDDRQLRYAFSAHHAGTRIAAGRITVVLGPPPGAQ